MQYWKDTTRRIFTQYNANRFSFLTNNTNNILTILIANLLTLGIIRTVDIFTCPLNRKLRGAKHEIGATMLKQRNGKTFGEDISVRRGDMLDSKSSVITRSLTMIIDLEMFHHGMEHWIGSKGDSRDILKS
jgi:hypothetical protein